MVAHDEVPVDAISAGELRRIYLGKSTRWGMLQDLGIAGVEIKTGTKLVEITESGAVIQTGDQTIDIEADSVVLAVGARLSGHASSLTLTLMMTYGWAALLTAMRVWPGCCG